MSIRHRGALAVTAAGLCVAATAVAGPAAAAPSGGGEPRFLDARELPPHPTSAWKAGPVTPGQPDALPVCAGEALPSTSVYRTFWTEFDTNAVQVTVVERDVQRAKEFAGLLRKKLDTCAERLEKEHPDVKAEQKYYGKVNVEEGAHVYGVHTAWDWGASDVGLLAVGRDGRTVTLVQWGQMGTLSDAPVSKFKTTVKTAVNKLY
ncbi:hypothetical protein [Streptomyces longispororuber]|uniref:hypothetical protein n=1 Tax=Streptomyces longispororuber TaxID=68230 RepID=UPI00167F087B|nr:hypothetical protein [Streptomyces longispororuber]